MARNFAKVILQLVLKELYFKNFYSGRKFYNIFNVISPLKYVIKYWLEVFLQTLLPATTLHLTLMPAIRWTLFRVLFEREFRHFR